MSRIGKLPIIIPDTVTITLTKEQVTVKGPLGELTHSLPEGIKIEQKDKQITCQNLVSNPKTDALHGLIRSVIANLVTGVTTGFTKTLEIQGTGYRVIVKDTGLPAGRQGIELSLGFSHQIVYNPPEGIKLEIKDSKFIVVSGADKHLVGQVAANIRDFRKPDAYKGKGIRYQGEYIKLKPGKTAKAAGE